ncbi:alpha/beta fold hydrolase [Nocardioides sp. R-C-SC26]|uniref:alpha/beta fold hydrolase n=1 Tax=Nocardioides sp. R-C-SC26 TaxID=2870414 RepID=UPI001E30B93F|nr:alpha/beta fold hydrolase [Nocardioides sp. R-C-SC26]
MTDQPATLTVPLPTHTASVLTWGEPGAPLVIALHGFPDTAWCWRHLGPALAEHGFRVAAPFLRGYGPSGIPSDGLYTVPALMSDVVALHRALGGDERAMLVGHDWGAIIANGLAAHPDSPFARVVALAVPPFEALGPRRDGLRTWLGAILRQPRKSWYIGANQVPGLSERWFERLLGKLWRDWSPGYDGREDVARVRAAVPDQSRARAVLSYYRHLARPWLWARAPYTTWAQGWMDLPRVPYLYLQGADDGCLDIRFARLAERALPTHARVDVVPGAGHFLAVERPDAVNALIAEFLTAD